MKTKPLRIKMREIAVQNSMVKKTSPIKSGAKKKQLLTDTQRDEWVRHILYYMEAEKPYRDLEITQASLAKSLALNVHQLSEVLNDCFQKNFHSFINLYRINEAKQMIQNPKYQNYTLMDIGYEAGFKSKTSFNRVFKDLVGRTPSDFRKQSS